VRLGISSLRPLRPADLDWPSPSCGRRLCVACVQTRSTQVGLKVLGLAWMLLKVEGEITKVDVTLQLNKECKLWDTYVLLGVDGRGGCGAAICYQVG
jgi:hypothetical protein